MDSPFKKFQQVLREDSAEQLPEGFSWEAMQTGIHKKMEVLEKAKKERRRRLFWWYSFGLSLVILLGAAGIYLGSQNSPEGQENLHTHRDSQQTVATAPAARKEAGQTSSSGKNTKAASATLSTPVAKPASRREESNRRQENSVMPTPPLSLGTNDLATSSPTLGSSPTKQVPLASPPSSKEESLNNTPRSEQQIDALTVLFFTVQPSDLAKEAVSKQPLLKEIPFSNTSDQAGWSIGFFSGSNRGSNQPIVIENEQIKAEETGLFAPYFQLQLQRSFRQNFFARGGLRWQQTNSFLEYNSTTSGSTLLQDAVLLRSINTSTGDTTLLRGDTLLASSSQRRLGQLNRRISLQIPLSLGYKKSFGSWEVGLHAGAVLELRQSNAGLFPTADGSIQALENYPNDEQSTPLIIHLQAGADLGYRIAPRLQIGLQANLQQQGKGWHPSNLHSRRPSLLSFGLGAAWQL